MCFMFFLLFFPKGLKQVEDLGQGLGPCDLAVVVNNSWSPQNGFGKRSRMKNQQSVF